jgi:thiosulfate/3-mercaptopyruvate sulfurtransferase
MLTTIVSAQNLAQHIDDPDWVVFDCRFTLSDPAAGKRAYEQGHIPNARYADLNLDLSSPVTEKTGRHPLPAPAVLSAKLGAWGVDSTKQVVVYDDAFGAMAGRMWWLLRWLGHSAVAVLDGGLHAWNRSGGQLSTDVPVITPATFVPRQNDGLWVGANQVTMATQYGVVLDARAEERFLGLMEPFDKVAGHVPGARNWPFEDNLDLGGKFLSPNELREMYEGLIKDLPSEAVVHMCGSGVTACHNVLAMEIAGLQGSKLYAGSWSEWITNPSRPVTTDEEPSCD